MTKNYRLIALGVLLGLLALYLVRGCSLMNGLIHGTYHIGQDGRWHGLHVMDKERNIAAFNKELLEEIGEKTGYNLSLSLIVDPLHEVELGNLQGALTPVVPNYANQTVFVFSEPYFRTGAVLLLPSSTTKQEWDKKPRKLIGVPQRTPFSLSVEQDPTVQLKTYSDILDALADLRAGKIDGAVFPAIPAHTYTNTFYKGEITLLPLSFTDNESIRLAALRNEEGEALVALFNKGLAELKASGEYKKLLSEWDLVDIETIR